jgi:Putative Flp pilus-assembly TadE/G-like
MSVTLLRWLRRDERGTVMVLMAVAMFPFLFLAAYAIDVSHWWDYSRNLQNRADAAALAGATQYGTMCFQGGNPGNVTTGAQAAIGEYAQLYSGAAPTSHVFYSSAQVQTGTGWNVTTNGYLNNTLTASPVQSPLTLRLGNLSDYWVILNGNNWAESGGTNFSMAPGASGATFCNSDPTQDLTDPSRASAGAAGPMVDVKVTQRRLPLFFSLISGRPTLHAHARVQLQGEASTPSEPIAVSDSGNTPCVTVYFRSSADNSILGTAVLKKEAQATQTSPIIWDNLTAVPGQANTGPTPVTMPPAGTNVYVQPFLNNCSGSGTYYDGDATGGSGVLLINTYGSSTTRVAGQPPIITPNGAGSGGVILQNGNCAPDYYFAVATGDCKIGVFQVNTAFAPGITKNDATVTAVNTNTGDRLNLSGNNAATVWSANGNGANSLNIGDTSGQNPIRIDWTQTAGTVNGQNCAVTTCTGSFGVRAQTFAACNGCDAPDDSGPIVQARVGTFGVINGGGFGPNAYPENSTQNLVVTLTLAGINVAPQNATPATDTVLRFPTSGNHQTGLVDCGQGNGGSFDNAVVYYGCGPNNPAVPGMNPLYEYTRPPGSDCSPAADGDTTNWPGGNHQDCVATTPGTRNPICPLVLRITGQPFGPNCNNNVPCPANNWGSPTGIPPGDPRAVTMIITAPSDFGAAGGPQGWLPIRRFATFYITGWDTRINPSCTSGANKNDPFPTKGKKNQQNEAVWGHWMVYVDTVGVGDGNPCPLNPVQPINCVPVLTR